MQKTTRDLIQKMRAGDKRALARLMTYVDNRHEDLLELMGAVHDRGGKSCRLGVTGPPGAGKSTLVDKLVASFRKQGKKVGVIAIDPSSPFSGGAVLGDRIRMQDHNADEGVFIRSLGSRGAHGGLSRATADIAELMTAFGFEMIVIETVGVGQTELDIMNIADTTLVVLVPESGDTIQTMKAGLMEIADIFIVNKSDREGADRIFAELNALSEMHTSAWQVPVIKTVATQNQGVTEMMSAIESHADFLKKNPKTRQSAEMIFWDILAETLKEKIRTDQSHEPILKELRAGTLNPYTAVQKILLALLVC